MTTAPIGSPRMTKAGGTGAEIEITDEALRAAERVFPQFWERYEDEILPALAAAAPLIVAAELDRLAGTFAKNSKACLAFAVNHFGEGRSNGFVCASEALRKRASELRVEASRG